MISPATNESILEAARLLKSGGLVAFPTETVYGLGANALDARAVSQIFRTKDRPAFDPLIVHIPDFESLTIVSSDVSERVQRLTQAFWPGPLTIILPKAVCIPDLVTSGLPDVAVRMPAHPVALELIRSAGLPIAAPSANKFGKLSPTTAKHVQKQLPDLPLILDGGPCEVGLESTVVRIEKDGFRILRHGAITREMLLNHLEESKAYQTVDPLPAASPGLMKSHYSPEKRLYIVGDHALPEDKTQAAYIGFGSLEGQSGYKLYRQLSPSGDLAEAAVNLFQVLHELEEAELEYIVAEPVPETGLGLAVMDRLRKAAFRFHSQAENSSHLSDSSLK